MMPMITGRLKIKLEKTFINPSAEVPTHHRIRIRMIKNGGLHPKKKFPGQNKAVLFVSEVGDKGPNALSPALMAMNRSLGAGCALLTVIYTIRSPATWRGEWGARSPIGRQTADTRRTVRRSIPWQLAPRC